MRADSGFYTRDIVTVCRKLDVRFSISLRQNRGLCDLIEAIPERETGRRYPTGWMERQTLPRLRVCPLSTAAPTRCRCVSSFKG